MPIVGRSFRSFRPDLPRRFRDLERERDRDRDRLSRSLRLREVRSTYSGVDRRRSSFFEGVLFNKSICLVLRNLIAWQLQCLPILRMLRRRL